MANRIPILLILLGLTQNLVAQTYPDVHWLNFEDEKVYSIFPDASLRVWDGEFWEAVDSVKLEGVDSNALVGVDRLLPITGSTPLHFVAEGTQQVYIYNDGSHHFYRDDITYERGASYNAIQWWRNDTLYSLGGTGFWHSNAVLSFYSSVDKQWRPINTKGGPQGVTNTVYQWAADGHALYVTYSEVVRGSQSDHSPEVWELHLNSKRWRKRGELTDEVMALLSDASTFPLPIGTLVKSGNEVRLLDLEENRIDHLDPSIADVTFQDESGFNSGKGTWVNGDYYIDYRVAAQGSPGKTIGYKFPFDKIRNARRNPEEVYPTGWPIWVVAVGVVVVLTLLFLLYRLYQKMRQPFLKGATMQAEEKFFNTLDPLEVKFLRALLRSEMRSEGLKSAPITEIMGWKDKSEDNQRKWRNNLIKELNSRAMEHLNIEELIYREKNPNDKRETVYRLNGDGFRLMRDSLHFTS